MHSLLGKHDKGSQDGINEVNGEQSKAIILYTSVLGKDNQTYEGFEVGNCNYDEGDDDKYPDLTHSLFDEEELDSDDGGCGSIIDMMRNSKEQEGQNFNLEEEIDHVADLFILKFHKQIRMQKLHSF